MCVRCSPSSLFFSRWLPCAPPSTFTSTRYDRKSGANQLKRKENEKRRKILHSRTSWFLCEKSVWRNQRKKKTIAFSFFYECDGGERWEICRHRRAGKWCCTTLCKKKKTKQKREWIVKYNTRSMLTMTHSSLIFFPAVRARDFWFARRIVDRLSCDGERIWLGEKVRHYRMTDEADMLWLRIEYSFSFSSSISIQFLVCAVSCEAGPEFDKNSWDEPCEKCCCIALGYPAIIIIALADDATRQMSINQTDSAARGWSSLSLIHANARPVCFLTSRRTPPFNWKHLTAPFSFSPRK